jgi:hypothetical protein
MECCANDFCPRLVEVVTVGNSPSSICDCMVDLGRRGCVRGVDNIYLLFGIVFRNTLLGVPGEYCSVPGYSVYLSLAHHQAVGRTVFSSFENQAPKTTSLCPPNDLGLNPSSGSKVYSRAVISLDVLRKYLSSALTLDM